MVWPSRVALELTLPVEPDPRALGEISQTAHLLSFVVIANRRHTDLFEWGQRTTPFNLSAEIQRRLLPAAFTCEAGAFTLSGWLEPAATIGGDTFDYSLARDVLHFSVTDAMGHGVASALTATLGVGSLRNSRRRGHGLAEQADAANASVAKHAGTNSTFLTAVLGRVDLPTGANWSTPGICRRCSSAEPMLRRCNCPATSPWACCPTRPTAPAR